VWVTWVGRGSWIGLGDRSRTAGAAANGPEVRCTGGHTPTAALGCVGSVRVGRVTWLRASRACTATRAAKRSWAVLVAIGCGGIARPRLLAKRRGATLPQRRERLTLVLVPAHAAGSAKAAGPHGQIRSLGGAGGGWGAAGAAGAGGRDERPGVSCGAIPLAPPLLALCSPSARPLALLSTAPLPGAAPRPRPARTPHAMPTPAGRCVRMLSHSDKMQQRVRGCRAACADAQALRASPLLPRPPVLGSHRSRHLHPRASQRPASSTAGLRAQKSRRQIPRRRVFLWCWATRALVGYRRAAT